MWFLSLVGRGRDDHTVCRILAASVLQVCDAESQWCLPSSHPWSQALRWAREEGGFQGRILG